jgi:zinc transport system substrate-binding protein
MNRLFIGLCLLTAALLFTCKETPQSAAGRLSIFVSIPPDSFFVKRIAGERADVATLVGVGQNPHTYAPTPGQMAQLTSALLYFRTGIEFENTLLPKLTDVMKKLKIVDLRQGITLRDMTAQESEDSAKTPESHAGAKDPHIWMSPQLVVRQAQTIFDALVAADTAGRAVYEHNYAEFVEELDSLDVNIKAALAPVKGKEFFVYHPAFGYFADAYGLQQVAIEVGGKEPSARHISRLIDMAKSRGVKVVFVQPNYSPKAAQALAEQIGGVVVSIDGLPADYLASMAAMATAIEAGLRR